MKQSSAKIRDKFDSLMNLTRQSLLIATRKGKTQLEYFIEYIKHIQLLFGPGLGYSYILAMGHSLCCLACRWLTSLLRCWLMADGFL